MFGKMKKFFRASCVTNVHSQRYALHHAEFLWRGRFLFQCFLNTTAWEMPAVWLLADLIGNVHKSSQRQQISGEIMGPPKAVEFQDLRNECFPTSRPVALPSPASSSHAPMRPMNQLQPQQPSRQFAFTSLKRQVSVIDLDDDDDVIIGPPPNRRATIDADHTVDILPQRPMLPCLFQIQSECDSIDASGESSADDIKEFDDDGAFPAPAVRRPAAAPSLPHLPSFRHVSQSFQFPTVCRMPVLVICCLMACLLTSHIFHECRAPLSKCQMESNGNVRRCVLDALTTCGIMKRQHRKGANVPRSSNLLSMIDSSFW